ncbi:MAG: hypothetical protein M1838_001153 [Thelocarpon superellum]|nr:MAG: hypothetical protein M1838_001153 [Thelocarpon superellum]
MAPQSRGRRKKKRSAQSALPQSVSTPELPSYSSFRGTEGESPERTPTTTTAVPVAHDSSLLNSPEDLIGEEDDDADFQSHYSLTNASSDSGSSDSDLTPLDEAKGRHSSLPHSSSSLLNQHPFAPPFYNRPPTPLPPSPSLTSLLRPTFSTTNSRPTTPDSSDVETPNDTEAAVAKSARSATTVPRVSPKVPTYEYYGFVLYLVSSIAFVMYLLWAYLPSPFLHQLGIHYYPDRWWALAIPSFLVMSIVYIYVALAGYNTGYLTLPMNSIENVVDEAANIATIDAEGRSHRSHPHERAHSQHQNQQSHHHHHRSDDSITDHDTTPKAGNPPSLPSVTDATSSHAAGWVAFWNEGTDAVMDVPVGGVCEILYGVADGDEKAVELG